MPVADIEAGAMARADDLVFFDLPIPYRAVIVRADIPNSIEFAGQIENYDRTAGRLDKRRSPIRHLATGQFQRIPLARDREWCS